MAEENPFGQLQPPKIETWGGMPQLIPQEGQQMPPPTGGLYGGLQPTGPEGSYFTLQPEVMNMLWAPQQGAPQPPPPQQPILPPLP